MIEFSDQLSQIIII